MFHYVAFHGFCTVMKTKSIFKEVNTFLFGNYNLGPLTYTMNHPDFIACIL